MSKPVYLAYALAACCSSALATTARATFHLMQIEQVIGGVSGDTTKQAIQLRMRAPGQNLVSQSRIRLWDAAGANPIMIIDMASNVPIGVLGSRVLITSADFNDITTPVAAPDFTMTNLIPSSYLEAGSMTFEFDTTGAVYWRLSWGGAAYTGPCHVHMQNDDNQNACPPFPGPLPSSGLQALQFQGPANAPSTTNEADYALTLAEATFINNANDAFTLQAIPLGACCLKDGACAGPLPEIDCTMLRGVFQGVGSDCRSSNCSPAAMGACCLNEGACAGNQTPAECADQDGAYMGDNSTCADSECGKPCHADINGNDIVDVDDLLAVINQWGGPGSADINADGVVDVDDLLEVINHWGPCV